MMNTLLRFRTTLLGVLAIALGFFAWITWIGSPDFPLDDAYIVQHTVTGVLAGLETSFPGSTPMAGATSPAHVLLVLLFALVMPAAWAQATAMALAIGLYVAGIYKLARTEGLVEAWARILAAYSVALGMTLYQLLNGLETALAMAAVAWSLAWFRQPTPHRGAHFALLGILPFIRPELGALSLILLTRACWETRKGQGHKCQIVRSLTMCVAGAAPFMLFLLATTGSIVPNTLAAKTYFFAEGCLPTMRKAEFVSGAVRGFAGYVGVGMLGFAAIAFASTRWIAVAFFLVFFTAFFVRMPGSLYHNHYRYLYLLLPFALAGFAAVAGSKKRMASLAGKVVLAAAVVWTFVNIAVPWRTYARDIDLAKQESSLSSWIASHLPADAPLLVHDAGYLSVHGTQPLIDLVGLKTPMSIAVHQASTWAACGRKPEAIAQIALAGKARNFVVIDDWDRIFRLTESLRFMGWSVERLDTVRGATRYKVYSITPP